MFMTAVSRRARLALVVVGAVVSACAGCGHGSAAPMPKVNARMAPVSLPPAPPASPDCQGDVKAQQDIPHPTLGIVRLFLVINPSTAVDHRGCVSAVASNGKVLPPIPIDVNSNSLNFANPVTDSTGNAFITYNPGRYDGVLVLIPTAYGFEDIGWADQRTGTRYYGKHAYYYANLEGPGQDGRYTIRQFNNDCTPTCAGGTVTSQDLHWNGTDYVP